MGLIGSVRCEKSWSDFVAQTFALIAPVHPVLHRVSCSYEMIPNAPKHYETHQNMSLGSNVLHHVSCSYEIIRNELKHYGSHKNMSLGSNGLDRVRSLWKITMWLRGTNFCINCTSSPHFAPSFIQLRNDPKCTQTLWKGSKTWV